jgi:hypothetical protein
MMALALFLHTKIQIKNKRHLQMPFPISIDLLMQDANLHPGIAPKLITTGAIKPIAIEKNSLIAYENFIVKPEKRAPSSMVDLLNRTNNMRWQRNLFR